MTLTVNGEPREVSDEIRLPDLLGQLGLRDKPCAVEVNRNVVPKHEHETCVLRAGDEIEVVTLVGGG